MSVQKIDCERCEGTGIGLFGPIDASQCGACRGRGWIEDVEDEWYDDDPRELWVEER